jgi:hypothetical protein
MSIFIDREINRMKMNTFVRLIIPTHATLERRRLNRMTFEYR